MNEIPIISHNPAEEDIITPKKEYANEKKEEIDYPESCFIFFQEELKKEFIKGLKEKQIETLLGHKLHLIEYNGKQHGIINFGIGAPIAALLIERLIARGFKKFIIIGIAGSLKLDSKPGDICLCKKALRDEGTSYHYLPPSRFSESSEKLNKLISKSFKETKISFFEGISWTTDAGYKESKNEARKYRDEGISCIDMEAASLFAIAKHRKVDLASVFILSDFIDENMEWKPYLNSAAVKDSLIKIKEPLLQIMHNLY